jgi:hypothetical protein
MGSAAYPQSVELTSNRFHGERYLGISIKKTVIKKDT